MSNVTFRVCCHCCLISYSFIFGTFFFFFKQKTAYEMRISDWSSDVCSSDLVPAGAEIGRMFRSWIKRVSNQPYKRNTVKTTRVAGRANSATITPALYPEPGGRARICPEGLLPRSGGDAGIGKHQTHRTRD